MPKLPLCVLAAMLAIAASALAGQPVAPAPSLPEVVGITLKPEDIRITAELNGRCVPYLVAEVRPQVNGIIQKRLFEEGSTVQAEVPLYQIDPSMYEADLVSALASLARTKASVAVAQTKERRYDSLVDSGAVTREEYDEVHASWQQAEADVTIAEAQVKIGRINVDYTKVRSPIAGVIGMSNFTQGALVTASQAAPLATVQQLDPIYVDVAQSTAGLRALKHALDSGLLRNTGEGHGAVRLVLEDGTPYPHQGQIMFSDVTVDQTTGSITLRSQFPNPEFDLLPGMYVKAVLDVAEKDNAIAVPQQSLVRNADGSAVVYLVGDDGTVERRTVIVMRALADRWLIADGLKGGERVVVEGIQRIRFMPGAPPPKVKFVEAAPRR